MFDRSRPRLLALLASAVLLTGIAGCNNNNSPTAPSIPTSLTHTDLRVGTGDEAVNGSTLTVNYTGWLYDGTRVEDKGLQVDTSLGRATFTFVLGAGQVIPGWDQGLPGMKVGGVRRLVVPPSLAYGSVRNGPIPPDSTLVFEIELLSITTP